ncbi:MAG: glycerophosphodiester phosphodiesterase family protein [Pseudomonadota bacterium]
MHRRTFLASAAALAATPAWPETRTYIKRFASPAELATYTRLSNLTQPLLMAHRAGYKPFKPGYPECSLVSAQAVIETGPAMIEVDIRRTKDGVMIPVHDKTLDRETTGTGPVNEITFAEFRRLKLRDATGAPTNIAPNSFEEFLDWGANGALLWLDTKDVDPAELVALIQDRGAEACVIVSAYGRETLEAYQAETQDLVHFVPLIEPLGLSTLEEVNAAGLDDARMIGFAGYYMPDIANAEAMRERDIPALLDLNRGDQRIAPTRLDPFLYERAVATGFPMFNTDQYAAVLRLLGITDWA